MTSKVPETGKLGLLVKMDYSETYRENDKLDVDLDEHLVNLTRSAQRVLTEKDEELETARADAEKILKLKEAVNNKEEEDPTLRIVCQSLKTWRRHSSAVSSASKRRKSSVIIGSARRASVMSSARESVVDADGPGEENGVADYVPFPDMKKMSLTERRLAKERDQFSAKNLFNVRRKNSAYIFEFSSRRADTSPDNPRTTPPSATLPNQSSPSRRQGRPMTSPPGRRPSQKSHGYMRPTTASASRTVTFARDGDDYGFQRSVRRPRSRRELQKLSELRIDPFGEEAGVRTDSWTSNGDLQQDLLHSLHVGRIQLQARVSAFLKTIEDFNKRSSKSGLEQILEAT